jgi:DNA-binding NarL/FixJ family response regulator
MFLCWRFSLTQEALIRVVLADDHHLVRKGIRALLEKAGDIEVVGEASNGCRAIELVEQLQPDVLVMDIAMPRMDGIQAMEQVATMNVATHVVVLSMYSDKALVRQSLRSGASGYLLKGSVVEELLLAVRAANKGDLYLSPTISRSIVTDLWTAPPGATGIERFEPLTAREREVLQLIAEGHTNASIAKTLKVSTKTVEKHRSRLMSKLGVHNLPGLMRAAIKHGLVFFDE